MNTLQFDQSTDSIPTCFGVSDEISRKIKSRLELYSKEEHEEIARKLKEAFSSEDEDYLEKLLDKAKDDDVSAREKIKQAVGKDLTYTETLEGFMNSQLFLTLGWTPKTPNDFFMIGFTFSNWMRDSKMASGMTEIVMKLIDRLKENQ